MSHYAVCVYVFRSDFVCFELVDQIRSSMRITGELNANENAHFSKLTICQMHSMNTFCVYVCVLGERMEFVRAMNPITTDTEWSYLHKLLDKKSNRNMFTNNFKIHTVAKVIISFGT